MSRLFDGVDDQMVYTVPASGVDVNGAHTLLIVVRQIATNDGIWQSYIETQTSAAAAAATLGRNNGGQIYWAQGVTATSAISMTDSDNWVVAAARKTAGSTIPTFSKCVVGGANTHTAGGGSLVASASIANGTIRIGGNDDFANIRVAAAAIFNRVLSDAEINGINSALTTQSIYDLTPVWLVDDLDAFATDYMNNADRTSITGTADDADDPSGWVYGISGGDATVTGVPATALADAPIGRAFPAVAPLNTVPPVLSGTPSVGQTLTVTNGTWDGDPTPTFTYKWCRGIGGHSAPEAFYPGGENTDWEAIVGETGNTYVLGALDVGEYVFCGIRGTNSEGVYDQSSNNSGQVTAGGATVVAVPADALADAPVGGTVVTANANVVAVATTALADAPLGVVSATAAGTVTAVPAVALASAPPANQIISSVVNAPVTIATASAPLAVVSTVGDSAVAGVPAVALGDAPIGALLANATVVAVVSNALGAAPAASFVTGSNLSAVPALALAQAPRPTISPAPAGGAGLVSLTTTFAEDAA